MIFSERLFQTLLNDEPDIDDISPAQPAMATATLSNAHTIVERPQRASRAVRPRLMRFEASLNLGCIRGVDVSCVRTLESEKCRVILMRSVGERLLCIINY